MSGESETIRSWEGFQQLAQELSGKSNWAFRGQQRRGEAWRLVPRIETSAKRYDIPQTELPRAEKGLIREFQRHYHHYFNRQPDEDDWMEWLAIMQHFGAPTRLVDATYSIYIALFFAIARARICPDEHIEIWAFDTKQIAEVYNEQVPEHLQPNRLETYTHGEYKRHGTTILRGGVPFVRAINSFMQNERQRIQQGLFLVPIDLSRDFMSNLAETESACSSNAVRRIAIPCTREFFHDALPALRRMNVTGASLFPDVTGFAESLQMRMLMSESPASSRDTFPEPDYRTDPTS